MMLELVAFGIVLLFTVLIWRNRPSRGSFPPGPRPLPIIGHLHLLGPLIHHCFRDLSSRYGPLIYLQLGSIPCVVASTPELAKELLKSHDLTFSSRQMESQAVDHLTYNSSFAFAPYGPFWKFMKKLTTVELLSSRALSHFYPIRRNEVNQLLLLLLNKSKAGESVNVTQELLNLANNVISQMMLSIRCSGTDRQAEDAKTLAREVTQIFGEFHVSDCIWLCRILGLEKGYKKRYEDVHRRFDALLENIITSRELVRKKNEEQRKMGTNGGDVNQPKDLLDMMLDTLEDQNAEIEFTRDNIKSLVLDFLTAGTDTTAAATEWALAELINHPKILQKARQEIDTVVGTKRLVEESDYPNLPYLQAIFRETFRLHPPIPLISRKSIQECKINGYTIPANSLLFVNMWAIGRDSRYWEDPLEFKPERFLKSNGDRINETASVDIKGQHHQLLPFGTGRRSCPGLTLAMQELSTTLPALIQCFEWKIEGNGAVDMTERHGLTVPRAQDLVCTPVPRAIDIIQP